MAVPRITAPGRAGLLLLLAVGAAACGGRAPGEGVTAPPSSAGPSRTTPAGRAVVVPNLVGLDKTRAVEAVLRLGLNVRVLPLGRPKNTVRDHVGRQIPLPGTPLAAGAEVVIGAWCQPIPCPTPPKGRTIYDPCTCATKG